MRSESKTKQSVLPHQPVKMLIVVDSPAKQASLARALKRLDETIDQAASDTEAMTLCTGNEYAVILFDVDMPLRNGFETASKIRKLRESSKTPIIFITEYIEDQAEILKGYDAGAVDFIFKPFNTDILRSKISVFFELYRMRQQLTEDHQTALQQQHILEEFIQHLRSGEIDRLVGTGRDNKMIRLLNQTVLDENNRLMSELTQANENLLRINRDLYDFSQIASHDLREPLRTVINYCALLKEDIAQQQQENVWQDIAFITKAAQRMKALVDDLLEFARSNRELLKPELVDLNLCLVNVLMQNELYIEESQAVIECPETLPHVEGDETQINRIFQNLINNGIKFTSPGSTPRILISSVSSPLGEDYCRLLFEDRGIGIDEQYRKKIFEPFQRLNNKDKYSGSGLGLAITKNIVRRHRGYIGLEPNNKGKTCFFIDLPKQQIADGS